MPKPHKLGIHLFRRDYRLEDNLALLEACKQCDSIIPVFIFTYDQIRDNPYKSNNCVQFLCESLIDLNTQLHTKNGSVLQIYYGNVEEVLAKIIKSTGATLLSMNMEYTAYGAKVEKLLKDTLEVELVIKEDITLNPMGSVRTTGGLIYTKYTPYYRAASKFPVALPTKNKHSNYFKGSINVSGKVSIDEISKFHDGIVNEHLVHRGGRQEALKILKNIKDFKDYDDRRNDLNYKTTQLSAYNKFGCASVREVYWSIAHALGKHSQIIAQLYWRDFFYTLSYYHPEIYKMSLNVKWRGIKWDEDPKLFKAWCEGRTGFPIVDAAMREINKTGFMHNRARLIVSNFLTRMLNVDWRKGEHYFAKMLYDYDPAQNNFGWQVSASVSGTESRILDQTIYNPWLQSMKFDVNCEYIKKWMPELKDISARDLHHWDVKGEEYIKKGLVKYILPIVDYKTAREANLKLYKKYISK
jgi:deoxyribodipyrimidine photo-lyase